MNGMTYELFSATQFENIGFGLWDFKLTFLSAAMLNKMKFIFNSYAPCDMSRHLIQFDISVLTYMKRQRGFPVVQTYTEDTRMKRSLRKKGFVLASLFEILCKKCNNYNYK